MIKALKDDSGMALLLSLLIIGIIAALTIQFNASMRSELNAAVSLNENIRLGSIAKSGFNYALAILSKDSSENEFDTLNDLWADGKTLSDDAESMFIDGSLKIQITDYSGRIQINQLIDADGTLNEQRKEILVRLLSSEVFDIEPEIVDDIVDAIKDWIDADDELTRFGAENAYYQTLASPYACRNGAMESLEELLLIKGITRDLFYGTQERPGISNYLRVQGGGKININTADPIVLGVLSEEIDDAMVTAMTSYRENQANDLQNLNWYQQVPGMGHISIASDLITTSSTLFEIISSGEGAGRRKTLTGLVERNGKAFQVLSGNVF